MTTAAISSSSILSNRYQTGRARYGQDGQALI
jgi:hypothetical protein